MAYLVHLNRRRSLSGILLAQNQKDNLLPWVCSSSISYDAEIRTFALAPTPGPLLLEPFFPFDSAGTWTHHLTHARLVFFHWVGFLAPLFTDLWPEFWRKKNVMKNTNSTLLKFSTPPHIFTRRHKENNDWGLSPQHICVSHVLGLQRDCSGHLVIGRNRAAVSH